jgi:hypothetical protein
VGLAKGLLGIFQGAAAIGVWPHTLGQPLLGHHVCACTGAQAQHAHGVGAGAGGDSVAIFILLSKLRLEIVGIDVKVGVVRGGGQYQGWDARTFLLDFGV